MSKIKDKALERYGVALVDYDSDLAESTWDKVVVLLLTGGKFTVLSEISDYDDVGTYNDNVNPDLQTPARFRSKYLLGVVSSNGFAMKRVSKLEKEAPMPSNSLYHDRFSINYYIENGQVKMIDANVVESTLTVQYLYKDTADFYDSEDFNDNIYYNHLIDLVAAVYARYYYMNKMANYLAESLGSVEAVANDFLAAYDEIKADFSTADADTGRLKELFDKLFDEENSTDSLEAIIGRITTAISKDDIEVASTEISAANSAIQGISSAIQGMVGFMQTKGYKWQSVTPTLQNALQAVLAVLNHYKAKLDIIGNDIKEYMELL